MITESEYDIFFVVVGFFFSDSLSLGWVFRSTEISTKSVQMILWNFPEWMLSHPLLSPAADNENLGWHAWVGFVIWCVLSSVCVCVRCYPFPISPLGWCFRCWTECMDRKNRIKNSCRSCERFNYEHPFGWLMFLISGPNCKIKNAEIKRTQKPRGKKHNMKQKSMNNLLSFNRVK